MIQTYSSKPLICLVLRLYFSSGNWFVETQTLTISNTMSWSSVRPPRQRILASLCSRESFAVSTLYVTAARMPFTLFAAKDMPIPVPQTSIPRENAPEDTASATSLAINGWSHDSSEKHPKSLNSTPSDSRSFFIFSFSSNPPWSLPIATADFSVSGIAYLQSRIF